jgi:biotin transport system substrate-specific component
MPQPNALAAPGRSAPLARDTLLVAVGVALLALSARAQVPFWPVPMTLQTLVVLGWAAAFGERIAVGSALGYLAIGALGLPVFAGTPERGIGLAYMMGPTGGYLVGFVAAAWFVGRLSFGRGFLHRLITLLLGVLIIDSLGALWLMHFLPPVEAMQKGAGLFVVVDLVKAAIVAVGATLAEPALKRFRQAD